MPETSAYELRLAAYFVDNKPHASFSHGDISTIAFLLNKLQNPWHRSPKTYIVLRAIQQLEIMGKLLDSGFDDGLFPVESSGPGLPGFLDAKVRQKIIQNQHLILSATWDLESGIHCSNLNTTPPFEILQVLGSGGYGQVTKIKSQDTGREYAHKTIAEPRLSYLSRTATEALLGEIRIIKSLRHDHVIQYIGSYTTPTRIGLIMSPIADYDLATFLDITSTATKYHPTLRTFFGCLANALLYLHSKHVRHRDITPRNVLVLNARVLFTDFGLSRDSLKTTSGPTAFSHPYCAQEVADFKQRNESADIWSLGCVFLEMFTSLQGHKEGWLREFYLSNGTKNPYFRNNNPATKQILRIWRASVASMEVKPLVWIEAMLVSDPKQRPSAAGVAEMIMLDRETSYMYSCNGCLTGDAQSTSVTTMNSLTPPSTRSIFRDDERSVPTQSLQASSPMIPLLGSSGREIGLAAMVSKRNEDLVRKQRSTIWYDAASEPANTLSERATTTQVTEAEQNANTEQVEGLSQAEIPTEFPEEETSASIKGLEARLQRPSMFGLTLEKAVQLAGQDISSTKLTLRGEKTHLIGRVPTIVAKCVERILQGDHNWIHVDIRNTRHKQKPEFLGRLEKAFEKTSDYGSNINWEGYKALDAANVLFSYLASLPEPLIPDDLRRQFPILEFEQQKAYAPSELPRLELYSNMLVLLPAENYHVLLCMAAVLSSRAQARQHKFSSFGWTNRAAQFCSHTLCSDPAQGTAILTLLIVNADYFLSVAKGKPKSAKKWDSIIQEGKKSQQFENDFTAQMQKDIATAKKAAKSTPPKEEPSAPAIESEGDFCAATVGSPSPKFDHAKTDASPKSKEKAQPKQGDTQGITRKGRSSDLTNDTTENTLSNVATHRATNENRGTGHKDRYHDQNQGDKDSEERPVKTLKAKDISAKNAGKGQSASATDSKTKKSSSALPNGKHVSPKVEPVTGSTAPRKNKTKIASGSQPAQDQDKRNSLQVEFHVPTVDIEEAETITTKKERRRSEPVEGDAEQALKTVPNLIDEEKRIVSPKKRDRSQKSKKTNKAAREATDIETQMKSHKAEASTTNEHAEATLDKERRDRAQSPRNFTKETDVNTQALSRRTNGHGKARRDEESATKQVRARTHKKSTSNGALPVAELISPEQAVAAANMARRQKETNESQVVERARVELGSNAAWEADRHQIELASHLDVPRVRVRQEAGPSQTRRESSNTENWDLHELDEPRSTSEGDTRRSRCQLRTSQTLEPVETPRRARSWNHNLQTRSSEQGPSRTASASSTVSTERPESVEVPPSFSPESRAEGRETPNLRPIVRTNSGTIVVTRRRGLRDTLHSHPAQPAYVRREAANIEVRRIRSTSRIESE